LLEQKDKTRHRWNLSISVYNNQVHRQTTLSYMRKTDSTISTL